MNLAPAIAQYADTGLLVGFVVAVLGLAGKILMDLAQ